MEAIELGKASKKVKKNKQANKEFDKKEQVKELKEKIIENKNSKKYEAALTGVIELLQLKVYDADLFFIAAELYFMTGDYERASTWIENTLEKDFGHVEARILLTRICMLENRETDALTIMEVLLCNSEKKLTEKQRLKVEEILEYFRFSEDGFEIAKKYPHVATFLGLESARGISRTESKAMKVFSTGRVDDSTRPSDEKFIDENMSQEEKISLCNHFAGKCYYEDRLDEAREFLLKALHLDKGHEETLQNMALLEMECGNQAAALQYIAKTAQPNFPLLKLIRDKSLV